MIMRLLKLGVSIAVLGLLIWWADGQVITERLKGANIAWLGTAFLTLTTLTFLMAKRWQIVATALQIELPFSRALSEYYISQLVNLVLPGGVIGDVGRAFRIRHEGDLIRAAQSVAAERMIGQAAMFVMMGVGFACALLIPGDIDWPPTLWFGILTLVCLCFGVIVFARKDTPTARFLRLVIDLMKDTRLIIYAVTITALLIFSLYACARAIGTNIPMGAVFTVIPLILSSMLIPLSVGGWGWREGAAAALFPLIGATPSAGIATGIAYGAMMALAAIPALIFLINPTHPTSTPQTSKLDSI